MQESEKIAHLIERIGRVVASEYHSDGFKPVQWEVLRYLSQANVFSRTPASVGAYLGITKGTTSQTLSTLERRGLIRKQTDKQDRRSTHLTLTAAGRKHLAASPLQDLVETIETLEDGHRRALSDGLAAVLLEHLNRRHRRPFGLCRSCRHNAKDGAQFRCTLLDVPLKQADTELICVEFEAAPAL